MLRLDVSFDPHLTDAAVGTIWAHMKAIGVASCHSRLKLHVAV